MIYSVGLGETFEYWKKSLADIHPYTDFCTYNKITSNKMNFRDSSHITSKFGKVIFSRIYKDSKNIIPDDFGILITPLNVNNHIKLQRRNVQSFSL
jgi:hypothetical protein